MAGKVFFSVAMTLDGFIAPQDRADDPDLKQWMAQWMQLQQWAFKQRFFRENLKLGEGGEEGLDNDIARATHERTGASVMGKRMFDAGELAWPEEAPFHTPIFVVTHTKRDPWERPGGTTFHFVNDGIEPALDSLHYFDLAVVLAVAVGHFVFKPVVFYRLVGDITLGRNAYGSYRAGVHESCHTGL